MNADTLLALRRFETAAAVLASLAPDLVPTDDRDRRVPVSLDSPAWPAIEDALDMVHAIESEPDADTPPAFAYWHRRAWLEIVRAASSAAGHGHDDAPRWANMTAAELADELEYLADHQG